MKCQNCGHEPEETKVVLRPYYFRNNCDTYTEKTLINEKTFAETFPSIHNRDVENVQSKVKLMVQSFANRATVIIHIDASQLFSGGHPHVSIIGRFEGSFGRWEMLLELHEVGI